MEVVEIIEKLKEIMENEGSTSVKDMSPFELGVTELVREVSWFPIEGEWCVFKNKGVRTVTIARYSKRGDGCHYDEYDDCWDECYKMDKELPSQLKL